MNGRSIRIEKVEVVERAESKVQLPVRLVGVLPEAQAAAEALVVQGPEVLGDLVAPYLLVEALVAAEEAPRAVVAQDSPQPAVRLAAEVHSVAAVPPPVVQLVAEEVGSQVVLVVVVVVAVVEQEVLVDQEAAAFRPLVEPPQRR